MSGDAAEAEPFLDLVERVVALDPRLSRLQAALLAAAHVDIAADSRSFANKLGVSHALVLREVTGLDALGGLIEITRRDARTLRTHYALSDVAQRLIEAARASA